ncbi:MAG TPA: TMEM175 family protein [Anaerolineales bacterium]|nr:TMEM175 family protein [Anaerolineales bacterium]
MDKGRLQAFSDGVLSILITIMVLELRAPENVDLFALLPLLPKFGSYVLSFIFLGIYWNNHHHLWQAVEKVNGSVLWANLHLLFWLSLIPFATSWMGEHDFATIPVALYGVILCLTALAYYIMVRVLTAYHDDHSLLADALGTGRKERISLLLYGAAIPLAFLQPWIAMILYVTVAIMWLIPDPRIEEKIEEDHA